MGKILIGIMLLMFLILGGCAGYSGSYRYDPYRAGITIILMGTMGLRMGIKATVIVVDGNTINGHADIKGRK